MVSLLTSQQTDHANQVHVNYPAEPGLTGKFFLGVFILQYCNSNAHFNPSQFLVTVNCLYFYNLARRPKSGNSVAELVIAPLNTLSPV